MKIKVKQSGLVLLLAKIHPIIPKASMPILQNVKLEAKEDQVAFLQATDLTAFLSIPFNCTVVEAGQCAIPMEKFYKIIKELPDKIITLECSSGKLTITCEDIRFKIAVQSTEEYPLFSVLDDTDLIPLPKEVISAIVTSNRCSSVDMAKGSINGVNVRLSNDLLVVEATDGHRAIQFKFTDTKWFDVSTLIPRKTVRHIESIGRSACKALLQNNQLSIISEYQEVLTIVLTSYEYPKIDRIVPAYPDNQKVVVSHKQLSDAIQRIALVTDDKFKGVTICSDGDISIVVTADTSNGSATETILAKNPHDPFTFRVSSMYAFESLYCLPCEDITIFHGDGKTPIIVHKSELERCFIMPMTP